MKPPSQSQSSPVFEGVYSNARMLHFLTAVVGSTCDVQVKNGTVYEGIFKTLSSQCDLAVDAVHKCSDGVAAAGEGEGEGGGGGEEGGGGGVVSPESPPPKMEEITDTMVFSPADLVTMTCRDVDLNYATRDSFTDTAISSSRVNGEHREKVLQRWDAGDSNGESYELEADAANGWDANEMFKSHEETYGVKSTYDSSLSMYTVPLERGNSDTFRQREARAARLATEIESSPQYRRRVSLENTDGKTEEERYSAVLRCTDRDDHRGATSGSPGFSSSGRWVPVERFESVCAELRQALNREQEAQGLLREQSAQLRTLTAQLHTHTADTTRTQHTLSQAAQEVRRKEQSLRILGKRLSAAQREKRELEDRLRQMEDSLTNTHRSKTSLVNFMTTVENTYKEVRDGLVQSRCSVTGKPLPLQLPRVHAELSGTERMMGGVEVTACERLVSTFADLYQAAGSRIGWLEQEISAQRGHVTALRGELQDACLRDNLAYIPLAEFSPLADPKACHRSPLSDLSKELPISRSSAQPCPSPGASS